jgi:hypothetical protein
MELDNSLLHMAEHFHNINCCWAQDHNQDSWKNEEQEREDQLDRRFSRQFLQFFLSGSPHKIRVSSESLANTGPKAITLDEEIAEGDHLIYPGSFSQIF